MAHELTPEQNSADERVDRFERFHSLSPGHYWRAVEDNEGNDIETGDVLLLLDVKYVDDDPHTAVLLGHPKIQEGHRHSRELHYLVKDFVKAFEYCPEGEQIREKEVAAILGQAKQLQEDLLTLQGSPDVMRALVDERVNPPAAGEIGHDETTQKETKGGLPGSHLMDRGQLRTDVGFAIEKGLSQADVTAMTAVAEHEAKRAEATATILSERTEEISRVLSQVAPFYAEKSAVALARTSQVRAYAKEIMQGIASMDLYTGKGVEVETLVQGTEAPAGEPLTLMQRKLFLEEELAVWLDVDARFDYRVLDNFAEYLAKHPGLRDQLLPTPRCVVSIAVRRTDLNYDTVYESYVKNQINKRVFLLVRNGETVHQVFSCQPSHEVAERLFPTHDEFDRLFTGVDGTRIKYNDIRFADRHKAGDNLALHYKRFLILLCGLDHRLKLFGDFYPANEALSFISMDFQKRHFHFAHDADRSKLLGDTLSLREFMWEKNRVLQSGSRVVCFYPDLIGPETAPAAYSYSSYGSTSGSSYNRNAHVAKQEGFFKIVSRRDKDLIVDVAMEREYEYDRRGNPLSKTDFNAKVRIASVDLKSVEDGVLCLDAVTPDELRRFVYNRDSRINHLEYLRLFKRALVHLEKEAAAGEPTIHRLMNDVLEGGLTEDRGIAQAWVQEAITTWRANKRGAPVPAADDHAALRPIRDQIHQKHGGRESLLRRVDQLIEEEKLLPLRLVLTGTNKPVLYAVVPETERIAGLTWPWVRRLTLKALKTKISVERQSLAWLETRETVNETVLKDWPDLVAWQHTSPAPVPAKQWFDIHDLLGRMNQELGEILRQDGWDERWFERTLHCYKHTATNGGKYIVPVNLHIPIGAHYNGHQLKHITLQYEAKSLLYAFGNEAQKHAVMATTQRIYGSPEIHMESLRNLMVPETNIQARTRPCAEAINLIESGKDIIGRPDSLDQACYKKKTRQGSSYMFSRGEKRTPLAALTHWVQALPANEEVFLADGLWDAQQHQVRWPDVMAEAFERCQQANREESPDDEPAP